MKNTISPQYIKAKAGQSLNQTDIAALVRVALKRAFPGVKFSVRSSVYSGGSSVDVSWVDGPTLKAVDAVIDAYETKGFDGSIDMAYGRDLWLAPDGTVSLAHNQGTAGSMGYVSEKIGSAHHPDAVLADFSDTYVTGHRKLSVAAQLAGVEALKADGDSFLKDYPWDKIEIKTSGSHAWLNMPTAFHPFNGFSVDQLARQKSNAMTFA